MRGWIGIALLLCCAVAAIDAARAQGHAYRGRHVGAVKHTMVRRPAMTVRRTVHGAPARAIRRTVLRHRRPVRAVRRIAMRKLRGRRPVRRVRRVLRRRRPIRRAIRRIYRRRRGGRIPRMTRGGCRDRVSAMKCNYYKRMGVCASHQTSHKRLAWTSCRKTCNLCSQPVPTCLPGYRMDSRKKRCVDINECSEKTATCHISANCINRRGSYKCVCKTGFFGDGVNNCEAHVTDMSPQCSRFAYKYKWCTSAMRKQFMTRMCPVTCGFAKVTCASGFKQTKYGTCVNINECAAKSNVCPVNSKCVDTEGSFKCVCNIGYLFNVIKKACVPYCLDLSNKCRTRIAWCYNGNYGQQLWMATYCAKTCQMCGKERCAKGYKLDSSNQCIDVDECRSSKLNSCVKDSTCFNTAGSYTCRCNRGFHGSGFTRCSRHRCFDLLSAEKCTALKRSRGCDVRAGYMYRYCAETCKVCSVRDHKTCAAGYRLHRGVCLDINECRTKTHKCPASSTCHNTFGGYRCQCKAGFSPSKINDQWTCIKENYCHVAGDPHFRTFDGAVIHYQGVCTYTLAEPNEKTRGSLTDFHVDIKNEHRNGKTKVSWAKHVIVKVYGNTIKLDRNRKVFVDGEEKTVPYEPNSNVQITASGRHVLVTTNFGLKVSFDGYHYVKVSVPDEYRFKMTGLCGNLDSKPKNDFVTKDGKPTTSHATIGNSWALPDPTEKCVPTKDEDPTDCDAEVKAAASAVTQCGMITDLKGPFVNCHAKVDPSTAFQSCLMDMCLDTRHPETLCRNIQAYADQCQEQGIIVRWRKPTTCPMTCPANSHYSSCMSACPASCANPFSEQTCTETCVEGCQCDQGYMLSGTQCVQSQDCGCMFMAQYRQIGESWTDKSCSFKYMCSASRQVIKVPITCGGETAECSVRNGIQACYCTVAYQKTSGTVYCDQAKGEPQELPSDPNYNPDVKPNQVITTTPGVGTTPGPTGTTTQGTTTPVYNKPDEEGEINDDNYFMAKPEPRPHPKARPLGVEAGMIPDPSLTASSSQPGSEPPMGRPLTRGGWRPQDDDQTPYFQVDLGKSTEVHGVGTLGHYSLPCWTTTYQVHTSVDGVEFVPLLDRRNGLPRVFRGNKNQNQWKRHCLHRYYGFAPKVRFVRFVPVEKHNCIALRVELYGFRQADDPKLVSVLDHDPWTKSPKGCMCYFDSSRFDCACCNDGACQCPKSNLHQCVQCGYSNLCGVPEIKTTLDQVDPFTKSFGGCQCHWDTTRFDCACCQRYGCQCGKHNKNQCVMCGHPEFCGTKENIFGPNEYCIPKTCSPDQVILEKKDPL